MKKFQVAEEIVGLYTRIKFIRVFYQTLITLIGKRDEQSNQIADCNRLLNTASDMIFIMSNTVQLGLQSECKSKFLCTYQIDDFSFIYVSFFFFFLAENMHIMGFEPLINQRLLPPTFPRYTKIKPRNESLMYFEDVVNRLKILNKIQTVTSLHQALVINEILNVINYILIVIYFKDFFIEFSKSSPCILSRSALQLLYIGSYTMIAGSNQSTLKEILKEAAKSFISPPVLMLKNILHNNLQVC